MQGYRVIPKGVFRLVAVTTLGGVVGATELAVTRRAAPYTTIARWLGPDQRALGILLTGFVFFVVWAALMFPLRIFSKAPTLREELDKRQGPWSPTRRDPSSRARELGIGGLVVAAIAGVSSAAVYWIVHAIWISGLVITALALVLGVINLIRSPKSETLGS